MFEAHSHVRMRMMKYIAAILVGWVGGAAAAIGVDPAASLAGNLGILALWPLGLILGHHSVLFTALLVIAVAQLVLVVVLRHGLPAAAPVASTFLLFGISSGVAATNLITLGSQI